MTTSIVRRDAGFTLLEAAVSLGVFAMMLTSLPTLLYGSMRANVAASNISVATALAEDKLEELKTLSLSAVVSGGPEAVSPTGVIGGPQSIYLRSWTVTNDTPVAGARTVRIAVSWSHFGASSIRLDSVLSE